MKFLTKRNLLLLRNTSKNTYLVVIFLFIFISNFFLKTISLAEENSEVTINDSNNIIASTTNSNDSADKEPPLIQIYAPSSGFQTNKNVVNIKGMISDNTSLSSLIIGNISYGISGKKNSFNIPINLKPGVNSVTVKAIDNSKNISSKTLTIFVGQKVPPKVMPKVTINKNKTQPQVITITQKKQDVKNNATTIKQQPQTKKTNNNNKPVSVTTKVEKKPIIADTSNVKKEITPKKSDISALNEKDKQTKQQPVITYYKPKKLSSNKEIKKYKAYHHNKKSKKTHTYHKHFYKFNNNSSAVKVTISIKIKDKNVNTRSTLIKNRTFIALDSNISQALNINYKVYHNSPAKVVLSRNKSNIVLHQGIRKIFDNNNNVIRNLEFSPFSSGDEVMVPLRAVAESLGFTVHWNNQTKTVYIW